MYTFFGCCVFDNVWVLVGVWTAGKSLPRIYFSSGNMSKWQFTMTTYILMTRISNSSLVVCGNHRHTVDIVDIYAPYWYVVNLHYNLLLLLCWNAKRGLFFLGINHWLTIILEYFISSQKLLEANSTPNSVNGLVNAVACKRVYDMIICYLLFYVF